MAEPETFGPRSKKLKRMPHIFSQVLELPFASDFPVNSEETETAFRFVIEDPEIAIDGTVKAEVVRIVPGAKKVVLRGLSRTGSALGELDMWRFRLPPSANPDATSASYEDGVLIVVVPKSWSCEEDKCGGVVANDKGSTVSAGPARPISVF
jgi:HSP20 family molecular chaperone IbpA